MSDHGATGNSATGDRLAAAAAQSAAQAGGAADEEEEVTERDALSASDTAALRAAGVTIDQTAADVLHENTGGLFAGDPEDPNDGSLDAHTIASLAGGGVPGVTVHAQSVLGEHATSVNDLTQVEFETIGHDHASGQNTFMQYTYVSSSPFVDNQSAARGDLTESDIQFRIGTVDWGEHNEYAAQGLAAVARTAYQAWSYNLEVQLGQDTAPLQRALGYQNATESYLDFSSADTQDGEALSAALSAHGLNPEWWNINHYG